MKIKTDENGYVTGYVIIGGMDGAEEYTGEIPDGFTAGTMKSYHLVEGVLTLDAEKLAAMQQEAVNIERLAELYELLNQSDYKIIKCHEYALAGLELPYSIQTLHVQRQAWRDEINSIMGN